ncbi:MAG TPA: hypothetical protein PK294_05415 [Ignavibacteria bacterium]|nr:hypothetical protein [Ignavibacteria bacterium]
MLKRPDKILILIFILYSGCGLFETRSVEPPTEVRSTFTQPTSPDIVLANLNFAVTEKNLDNYMRCLVDSNFSTKRFKFIPDAVSQTAYPVFLNWNLSSERIYFSNLISSTEENSSTNLFLSNINFNTGIDSAVIDSDYILVFNHNRQNIAQVTKGRLRFVMSPDVRSLWSIHSWSDFINDNGDTTWSVLKANMFN